MALNIGFVGSRCRPWVERLAASGAQVAWCAPDEALDTLPGIVVMPDAPSLAKVLQAPRVAWLRLASGFATELAIQDIWPEFSPGDVIVDAGGGDAADGRRRAASLASASIGFVDCGWRADDQGVSLLVGGEAAAIRAVAPYAEMIAGSSGWTHCGPAGAGYRA